MTFAKHTVKNTSYRMDAAHCKLSDIITFINSTEQVEKEVQMISMPLKHQRTP